MPPELVVEPVQQLGHLFIVQGRTEVGALLTINGAEVEVDGSGRFRRTVNVTQVGSSRLVICAMDSSGNKKQHVREVFVED